MKKLAFFLMLLIPWNIHAADYYMRSDGTAANKGLATSCDAASSAMNITVHNGETFSAGDNIYLCDDGGDYTAGPSIPSGGTSGNVITYQEASGDTPNFDISGAGWQTNGNTYITISGIVVDIDTTGPAFEIEDNSNNITIDDVEIYADNVLGIRLNDNCNNFTLSNSYINSLGTGNRGFSTNLSATNSLSDLTIENSDFITAEFECIYIAWTSSQSVSNVTIDNVYTYNCGTRGISILSNTPVTTKADNITIKDSRVYGSGQYGIYLRGIKNTGSKEIESNIITETDMDSTNSATAGLYLSASDDLIVTSNYISGARSSGSAGHCIHIDSQNYGDPGSDTGCTDIILSKNKLSNCSADSGTAGAGVRSQESTGMSIISNIIYNNADGILFGESSGTASTGDMYNNTISDSLDRGLHITGTAGATNVKNNISWNNGNFDMDLEATATSPTATNNIYETNENWATDASDINTDPQLIPVVFAVGEDSPAIGAGTDVGYGVSIGGYQEKVFVSNRGRIYGFTLGE